MERIHKELRRPVLADIASFEDAIAAVEGGAAAVATTLYGYTPESAGRRCVNWDLVSEIVKAVQIPVIVEGHVRHPDEVRRAFECGAFAVVVGAAITSPRSLSASFAGALPPCG
jgi:N-acylglucosamine-6-phosphate 2-epimerase